MIHHLEHTLSCFLYVVKLQSTLAAFWISAEKTDFFASLSRCALSNMDGGYVHNSNEKNVSRSSVWTDPLATEISLWNNSLGSIVISSSSTYTLELSLIRTTQFSFLKVKFAIYWQAIRSTIFCHTFLASSTFAVLSDTTPLAMLIKSSPSEKELLSSRQSIMLLTSFLSLFMGFTVVFVLVTRSVHISYQLLHCAVYLRAGRPWEYP